VAGGIGVVSALTPELASRSDFVRGVLPPGVPEAARVLALALGLALIWISRSLARRKRRAWQLAVGIVLASAAAHLAKGLDVEEALATLVLLAALWRWRRAFHAPGDPAALRPLRRALLPLGALGAILALRASAHLAFPDRLEDALGLLAGGLTIRALYLWLRPVVEQAHQSVRERALAERLVREHGGDGLAYFALRHDKSYFFAPSGRSFLAYRVVSGCALVSGDPIGEPGETEELLSEFRRVAQSRGWRVAILGASSERIEAYRSLGFRPVYLGDEGIVHPAAFSLEGRPIRKVRQSVHRLEKAGYRVRLLAAGEAEEILRCELRRVSAEWRGHWPERGFTMAMDGLFAYPDTVLAVAEAPDGRIGGFIQLVPTPASGGYSLATMRRCRATPNGLMEYLIVETILWARERGVPELSLNFSVFAGLLRAGRSSPLGRRALRLVLFRLDRLFQLERLHSFNRKFFPEWRPRYVCIERLSDFPVVGLAYLQAESLLTPPGPWVHTPDLASR
jgi:lysyl-tRNA synthetase class 2